jgi:putative oxidoreductase
MNTTSTSTAAALPAEPMTTGSHCTRDGLCTSMKVVSWVLQIMVAAILAQTLYFKFTAAPESVYIFKTLGLEPWGRIGSGVAELIAAVLLLVPRTTVFGAILALGVITGAIGSHLTKLGIVVQNDGGLLFGLAVLVFVGSLGIVWIRRRSIPIVGPILAAKGI